MADSGAHKAPADSSANQEKGYRERILESLRRIIRAVDLYSRKLASTHQITVPQLVCLMAIAAEERVTASQLSKRVHLSASTVVGILDRLEEKGLVVRERDRADRRVLHLVSTAAGKELAANAPSPLQDQLEERLQGLPNLEQATIALALERLVDLMEARDIDAGAMLAPGHTQPPDPSSA